ncbi:hypothetical protein KSS87_002451 [Heliosperma pusillum]|nr:hypothetical protein KSS87_002451 [Heliosperma pusillum]
MGNEGRLIVHKKSYNANNWVMKKERQGVKTKTLGDEEMKTHCSHRSYIANI